MKDISWAEDTPNVTFTYDPAGNRTSMTDGAGVQTYTYDPARRLTTVVRGSITAFT